MIMSILAAVAGRSRWAPPNRVRVNATSIYRPVLIRPVSAPVLDPDRRQVPGAVRDAMSRSCAANKSLHAFRSAARRASSATAPSGGGPRCRAKPALKSALRAASDRECAVGRARASATAHCTSGRRPPRARGRPRASGPWRTRVIILPSAPPTAARARRRPGRPRPPKRARTRTTAAAPAL